MLPSQLSSPAKYKPSYLLRVLYLEIDWVDFLLEAEACCTFQSFFPKSVHRQLCFLHRATPGMAWASSQHRGLFFPQEYHHSTCTRMWLDCQGGVSKWRSGTIVSFCLCCSCGPELALFNPVAMIRQDTTVKAQKGKHLFGDVGVLLASVSCLALPFLSYTVWTSVIPGKIVVALDHCCLPQKSLAVLLVVV